jgi:microcystin-dependent protein
MQFPLFDPTLYAAGTTIIPELTGYNTDLYIAKALGAVATNFSGAADPFTITTITILPFMTWADTGNNILKIRNATNDDWISTIDLTTGAPIISSDPIGTVKEYYGIILPSRYLWVNGCTIGDINSNATGRANSDTIDLYTVLWDAANVTGSQIQLYDSSGTATTKGISASNDFAAHKRLSLPDKRGRVAIGLDNMGGTSANVVTNSNADILGGYDGEENHTLTITELAAHHHSIYSYASTYGYAYGLGYNTPSGLGGANSGGTTGSGYYNTDSAGHQIVSTTGSGTAHNTMQPWVACNFIMRY